MNLRHWNSATVTEASYLGKGVLKAVENINTKISEAIDYGLDASDIYADRQGNDRGRRHKRTRSNLGANAILAVSIANSKSSFPCTGDPAVSFAWRNFRKPSSCSDDEYLKRWQLMQRILVDVQEFMIMPVGAPTFRESTALVCRSFPCTCMHFLKAEGLATSVGDEGGFAPEPRKLMKKRSSTILEASRRKQDTSQDKDFMHCHGRSFQRMER